jgi:hypothetical protein
MRFGVFERLSLQSIFRSLPRVASIAARVESRNGPPGGDANRQAFTGCQLCGAGPSELLMSR